jgi:hypothetical protein
LLWDLCGTSYPPVSIDASSFMDLARKIRSSSLLCDRCNLSRLTVGDAQHCLRAASAEDEIRLVQQMTHIGARVMTCHRMIGMAKQCFPIFGGDSSGAQTARERMTKVVDTNQS